MTEQEIQTEGQEFDPTYGITQEELAPPEETSGLPVTEFTQEVTEEELPPI